jgi:hypothetical protein
MSAAAAQAAETSTPEMTTFRETFDGGEANGWVTYGGNWMVSNGQYSVKAGTGYKSVAYGASFLNLVYAADVAVSAAGDAGLIFRVTNPAIGEGNFAGYYAGIDAGKDRVMLGKMSNEWTEIASIPYAIEPETWYHLKVEMKSKFIEVWINDTHIISAVDAAFGSAGAIGVLTFDADARFDQITAANTGNFTNPSYDFSWVKGAVFVPTNAINEVQQWDEYDPAINARELYYCHVYGINLVRVYLHYLVWEKDWARFLQHIENFLQLADQHGIKVEFVFFDDCWDPNPTIGAYPPPLPGVHNSRWVQCPGNAIKDSYALSKPKLQAYVQDVVAAHKEDQRIAFWEPYNEPGNNQSRTYFQITNQLLNDSRIWIRETGTTIPITSTDFARTKAVYVSDFYSWHPYDNSYAGPRGAEVLVTESMRRREPNAQTVPGVDQAFYHNAKPTGYIMWEAGIGRDNCRFAWGENRQTPAKSEPAIPFHGIIYPDGHPWSLDDAKALRNDDLSAAPVFNVEYFTGDFAVSKKISVTPLIDFDLGDEPGTGSPDASAGIDQDHFAIRWTGKVIPAADETYTFYVESDNIARLWIGDTQIINKTDPLRHEVSGAIRLTVNTRYDVKIEYVHDTGNASMHVTWSGPDLPKQVLPGRR